MLIYIRYILISTVTSLQTGGDGGLHGSPLLVVIEKSCRRKTRRDKLAGHPIFTVIWHALTVTHKGEKKKHKMLKEKDIVAINGKMRAVSVFVTHQRRIMECSMREIHEAMLQLLQYLSFRTEFMLRNPKLPDDWQVLYTIHIFFMVPH